MEVLMRVLSAACMAGIMAAISACEFPRPAHVEIEVDALPLDTSIDNAVDARLCFGTFLNICLEAVPSQPLRISDPTTISTDYATLCTAVTSSGNYCVIAATTISIEEALRAIGTRPLVLIATDAIVITSSPRGLVDVGSHREAAGEIGAGADPEACAVGAMPGAASGTGGGGAGGSFMGPGGAGGTSSNGTLGGTAGATMVAVNELRGGCSGQDGGGMSNAGAKGHGGGAVLLIAGNTIDVQGAINAAGEGGHGASTSASGGGGGGSGGMIVLDAPRITNSGLILASGAGGGGGAGESESGGSGSDPDTTLPAGGGSGQSNGGNGGLGSRRTTDSEGRRGGDGGTNGGPGGGGGGGGGAGLVKAPIHATLGPNVSPPPTL